MFVLSSDITIGTFRFNGVHEVRIKRSLHSYMDNASITLPGMARIAKKGSNTTAVKVTGEIFKDGQPVTINLGYNGVMHEEFRGFVKRRDLAMPLVIECEGYSYPLRNKIDYTKKYSATRASELLGLLKNEWQWDGDKKANVKGDSTGIKIIVANDLPLINVTLTHNNGIEIIEAIKRFSQGMLNVFFVNPTTLWCGLTYTPYAQGQDPFMLGKVNYRLGYNVVIDNNLKQRILDDERVQVLYGGTLATGQRVMTASDDKVAKNKQKAVFNYIGDEDTMKILATEKQYQVNYSGYEGSINGFMEPYCLPGYQASITDGRYPQRNGTYMIEATELTFGMNGARRKVEIGPLLNFNKK